MDKCLAIIALLSLSVKCLGMDEMDVYTKCREKHKTAAYNYDGVKGWPNREMMCRMHCVLEGTGSMTGNKINHEHHMMHLGVTPVDWKKADLAKAAEKCKIKAQTLDKCETAFKYYDCLRKIVREHLKVAAKPS
ncbi:hypothetical protein R5R35_011252 [Gryllus longicercus]|uniref:Odorant binding protein n=1 Tax=Gryllus longicercus TaxID=2509291 RepID=A0AAN9ZD69_9ORTH